MSAQLRIPEVLTTGRESAGTQTIAPVVRTSRLEVAQFKKISQLYRQSNPEYEAVQPLAQSLWRLAFTSSVFERKGVQITDGLFRVLAEFSHGNCND